MYRLTRILALLVVLSMFFLHLYSVEVSSQTVVWSVPKAISEGGTDAAPQIIEFKGSLYAFWRDSSGHLVLSSSSDGGALWSEPKQFSGYNGEFYVPYVTTNRRSMILFWVDRGVGFSVVYASKTNNGMDWNTVRIGSGDADYRIPVAIHGTEIWLLGSSAPKDAYLYVSRDGGSTWDHVRDLHGIPVRNSALFFDGDVMHIVSSYEGSVCDHRSSDMGISWSETEIFKGNTSGSIWAGYNGGRLYSIWSGEKDSGYQLMASISTDSGSNWSDADILTLTSGSAYYPDAVFDSAGNIHMVWQDNRFGKWDAFYMEMDPSCHRIVGDLPLNEEDSGTSPCICSCNDFFSATWVNRDGNSIMFSRFPDMSPSFTSVRISNNGIFNTTDIYASVVDEDPISVVGITYRGVDGKFHDILMDSSGVDRKGYPRYFVSIPPQNAEGNISLNIWAQDERGNRGLSETYTVTVGDNIAPSISLRNPPITAERGKSISIKASVSDEHLSTVYLDYYVGNRFNDHIRMVQEGGYFTATIPPQDSTIKIIYHVWANDTYGNVATTRNYTLEIVDTTPPKIVRFPNGTIDQGEPIIISFDEKVDTISAENSIVLVGMKCSFRWINGSSVEIIPEERLKPGETYTLVLARGLTDVYGNSITETQSFDFTVKENENRTMFLWAATIIISAFAFYVIWKKDLIPISINVKRKKKRR